MILSERFKSFQGEGIYTGVPMAFMRTVGCSVGKRVCHYCDTDFDKVYRWQGGGEYSNQELAEWAKPLTHVCITGGEPFDQGAALVQLVDRLLAHDRIVHIETSGTVPRPEGLDPMTLLTVCPKPGWLPTLVRGAHEVKVIVPGLGNGPGWPELEDALRWHSMNIPVFLQPRNEKRGINQENLALCQSLCLTHGFGLSVQTHKLLQVR